MLLFLSPFPTPALSSLGPDTPQVMVRVVLVGACGGIGQPLSLLLKMQPGISELGLFDLFPTKGNAADLSHISSDAKITSHTELADALVGASVVVIPAGMPRKPGMTRDDLFKVRAS